MLRERPELQAFVEPVVQLLTEFLDETDEPLALLASWSGPQLGGQVTVHLSTMDVRKIRDFSALTAFIRRPDVVPVGLVSELPTDEPTQLQWVLEGRDPDSAPRRESSAT